MKQPMLDGIVACGGCHQALVSDTLVAVHLPVCGGPCGRGIRGRLYSTQMLHTALKGAVQLIMTEANLYTELEVANIFPGSRQRPADVLITSTTQPWALAFTGTSHSLCIDVTVVRLATNVNVHTAAKHPGKVLEDTEEDKRRKYRVPCDAHSVQFCPFVVDDYGHIGQHAEALLIQLAHRSGTMPGDHRDGRTASLRAQCRLRRWRGYVGAAIHSTMAQAVSMLARTCPRGGEAGRVGGRRRDLDPDVARARRRRSHRRSSDPSRR